CAADRAAVDAGRGADHRALSGPRLGDAQGAFADRDEVGGDQARGDDARFAGTRARATAARPVVKDRAGSRFGDQGEAGLVEVGLGAVFPAVDAAGGALHGAESRALLAHGDAVLDVLGFEL